MSLVVQFFWNTVHKNAINCYNLQAKRKVASFSLAHPA